MDANSKKSSRTAFAEDHALSMNDSSEFDRDNSAIVPASSSSPATFPNRPSEHQTSPRPLYQEEAGILGGRLRGDIGFNNYSSTVGDRNTVGQRGAHNRQDTKGDGNTTLQDYFPHDGNVSLINLFPPDSSARGSSSTAWHMAAAIGLVAVAVAAIVIFLPKLFGNSNGSDEGQQGI